MSIAGAATSAPDAYTRNWPGWVVISMRPSGVKASAVGAATGVTSVSVKFGGAAVSAGRAEVRAIATIPIAAAAAHARRRSTFLLVPTSVVSRTTGRETRPADRPRT